MPRRLAATALSLGRRWLDRLGAMTPVDRAVALAALAFSSLFPLLIVYDAVVPTIDGQDFATSLIDRFALKGSAADGVRQALAQPGEVRQSVGVLGVLLVVISALSFARGLQRLYSEAFRMPRIGGAAGVRATLLWLALVPAYITVRDVLNALTTGTWDTVGTLVLAAVVWTATPFVLLGRRLPGRALLPTGLITAGAMSLLSIGAELWMTRAITESAGRYGVLGIAFAVLSWLVAAGFVLVGSAAAGAVAVEAHADRG